MLPTVRSDEPPISKSGARVRARLLQAAGEVFAEKGLQGATSRDICLHADVNLAAVNYHFGGFEALYVATLKEAHQRVEFVEPFALAGFKGLSAKDKLRAIIRNMVGRLSQSTDDSWEMRLVSREMAIPTFAQDEFIASSIEPRRALLRSYVGEIIGRPTDDPVVARCLFTLIAPCIMLAIVNRSTFETLLPGMGGQSVAVEALIDHIERFVFAGLDAVVRELEGALDYRSAEPASERTRRGAAAARRERSDTPKRRHAPKRGTTA